MKQSIFDYDLLLARSLSNSNQPADLAIRDFVVELSKTEGKINAFLSAAGVVGGVGVCASGAGTMACAAGALGALASGNHLYGDAQQAITGNEARTALVQALTAQGLNPADAAQYQAYIDAGAVVVTLGIVGGQAVYRFTVNSTRVTAADRAALEVLSAPNKNQLIDDLMRGGTRITPQNVVDIRRLRDGRTVWLETGNSSAGLQHILEGKITDFATRGIQKDQIPDLIFEALENGRIVATIGSGRNLRPVYEVEFNGGKQIIAVGVGDNGFIVNAHPYSVK